MAFIARCRLARCCSARGKLFAHHDTAVVYLLPLNRLDDAVSVSTIEADEVCRRLGGIQCQRARAQTHYASSMTDNNRDPIPRPCIAGSTANCPKLATSVRSSQSEPRVWLGAYSVTVPTIPSSLQAT